MHLVFHFTQVIRLRRSDNSLFTVPSFQVFQLQLEGGKSGMELFFLILSMWYDPFDY